MEKQGRKTIPITPSLRLVPYYPAYETALPWYQDAELCHQVDNQNRIYDLSILKNMYEYLNAHGDLFYIEYEGNPLRRCLFTDQRRNCHCDLQGIPEPAHRAGCGRKDLGAGTGKGLPGVLCGDLFVQCTVPGNVPLNRICAEGCRNVCLSAEIKRRNIP